MHQTLQIILIFIVVALIAFPILVYMGINTPLPFANWGHSIIAFFSGLNIGAIPITIGGLIGGLGAVTGIAGALGYAYKKLKGSLQQAQTALASTKQQAQSLVSEKASLATENEKLQAEAASKLNQISAEKQAAIDQANGYKTQAENLQEQLRREAIAKEELVKQNIANFTQKLPGNSVAMDPNTGNMIKTVEKVIVK